MAEHRFILERGNVCADCGVSSHGGGIAAASQCPANPLPKPLDSTQMHARLMFVEGELMRRDARIKVLEERLEQVVKVAYGRK